MRSSPTTSGWASVVSVGRSVGLAVDGAAVGPAEGSLVVGEKDGTSVGLAVEGSGVVGLNVGGSETGEARTDGSSVVGDKVGDNVGILVPVGDDVAAAGNEEGSQHSIPSYPIPRL